MTRKRNGSNDILYYPHNVDLQVSNHPILKLVATVVLVVNEVVELAEVAADIVVHVATLVDDEFVVVDVVVDADVVADDFAVVVVVDVEVVFG